MRGGAHSQIRHKIPMHHMAPAGPSGHFCQQPQAEARHCADRCARHITISWLPIWLCACGRVSNQVAVCAVLSMQCCMRLLAQLQHAHVSVLPYVHVLQQSATVAQAMSVLWVR